MIRWQTIFPRLRIGMWRQVVFAISNINLLYSVFYIFELYLQNFSCMVPKCTAVTKPFLDQASKGFCVGTGSSVHQYHTGSSVHRYRQLSSSVPVAHYAQFIGPGSSVHQYLQLSSSVLVAQFISTDGTVHWYQQLSLLISIIQFDGTGSSVCHYG